MTAIRKSDVVLTGYEVSTALAHEGIELPADVVGRIVGDLNTRLARRAAGDSDYLAAVQDDQDALA